MKVEILFPEVGNLCGDLMNIRYLRQCCPELEVVETDLKSRPAFLEGGVDLVYMGSATEKGLELMVKALTPYREELAARVDGGQRMLVTGNALDALWASRVCSATPTAPTIPARGFLRWSGAWGGGPALWWRASAGAA